MPLLGWTVRAVLAPFCRFTRWMGPVTVGQSGPSGEDQPAHNRGGREQRWDGVSEHQRGRSGAREGREVGDDVVAGCNEPMIEDVRGRDYETAAERHRQEKAHHESEYAFHPMPADRRRSR